MGCRGVEGVDPTNPNAEILTNSLRSQRARSLELHVLKASTERDIRPAFETNPTGVGGLVIPSDVFLITHEEQLAALALRGG